VIHSFLKYTHPIFPMKVKAKVSLHMSQEHKLGYIQLYSFLTTAWTRVVSFMPRPYPPKKDHMVPNEQEAGGPDGQSGCCKEEIIFCLCRESNPCSPSQYQSCYTHYAILAPSFSGIYQFTFHQFICNNCTTDTCTWRGSGSVERTAAHQAQRTH